MCHCRPILAICPSTRSLQDTRKWVFWIVTDRKTNKQTNIATLWLNRPRGRFSENVYYFAQETWYSQHWPKSFNQTRTDRQITKLCAISASCSLVSLSLTWETLPPTKPILSVARGTHSGLMCAAWQCGAVYSVSTVQWRAAQYSAVFCSTVQCRVVQHWIL